MRLSLISPALRSRRAFFSTTSAHRLNLNASLHGPPRPTRSTTRRVALTAAVGVGVLGSSAYLFLRPPLHADADSSTNINDTTNDTTMASKKTEPPLSTLLRAYLVFTMCSFPTLVDHSPTILATLGSIPGLKQATEAFVRATFFSHVSLPCPLLLPPSSPFLPFQFVRPSVRSPVQSTCTPFYFLTTYVHVVLAFYFES